MQGKNVWVMAVAMVISAAMIGAGLWHIGMGLATQRYEIMESGAGNNVAWKLDRLTGQAYGCEESEFGPFCIAAPNQIKHGP